jgi:hypothetical protein
VRLPLYTPEEFAEFIQEDPKAAVDWLRGAIGEIESHDMQTAAKALLLLVLIAQALRAMLHYDEDEYDDLMNRLARLSILLDDRLDEFLNEWGDE